MANRKGPRASKRRLLCSVVHSIILYAIPAWGKALEVGKWREKIIRIQRCIAMRVCSAYKTVSYEAALVVAGIPPIQLLAKERNSTYNGDDKREAREEMWREWQHRWETTTKARWTRFLIPNVRAWVERKHGEVGFHLTQILTGHGCFVEYLYDIGKKDNRECNYCGEIDDAGHTFFRCPRWNNQREVATGALQTQIREDNMIPLMLQTEENWKAIEILATGILSNKEREEKELGLNP